MNESSTLAGSSGAATASRLLFNFALGVGLLGGSLLLSSVLARFLENGGFEMGNYSLTLLIVLAATVPILCLLVLAGEMVARRDGVAAMRATARTAGWFTAGLSGLALGALMLLGGSDDQTQASLVLCLLFMSPLGVLFRFPGEDIPAWAVAAVISIDVGLALVVMASG